MERVWADAIVRSAADRRLADVGEIEPAAVRQLAVRAVVDPNVSMLILPESVARFLGVSHDGEARVSRPGEPLQLRPIVRDIELELFGRRTPLSALVDPGSSHVRLGRIVLTALDLVVDSHTQTLHPRDPDTIIAEIE